MIKFRQFHTIFSLEYHIQVMYTGCVGNGGRHDFEIVSRLPVYFEKVQEVYIINGNKEIKESRYLMISDLFFVLFDFDFFNKSNLRLVFWSTIKSLSFMREILDFVILL